MMMEGLKPLSTPRTLMQRQLMQRQLQQLPLQVWMSVAVDGIDSNG
jgi:hypothetical protein